MDRAIQGSQSAVVSLLPETLRQPGYVYQFYAYNADFLPLAANATQQVNVTIQSDADFVIVFATGIVTSVDNGTLLPFVPQLVMLRDTASGIQLMQDNTHYNLVYGDAQNPALFTVPFYLRAGSTLQVQHQNLSNTAVNVRLAFQGFRAVPGRR
jgi:hypothetical protein